MKTITLDTAVIHKIMDLHRLLGGEIPEYFIKKGAVRTGYEFDPNSYFAILTHLTMKPGYRLDYYYGYEHAFAGSPRLYARPIGERRFRSIKKYWKWEEKNSLISFLITDGSPDGFFQLAVFQRLKGQFYLYWHAHYNDKILITSSADMEKIIDDINEIKFGLILTPEQVTAMRSIPAEPNVEFDASTGHVTYCIFTKWGGFQRLTESYNLIAPHLLVKKEILYSVKYDCGVMF